MADIEGIDPAHSNAFAKRGAVSRKDRAWVWKARFGAVVTRKRLVQWGKLAPGMEGCVRCSTGQSDTVGHRLGGCTHEQIGGMHTKRHDAAVRMIVAAAQGGKRSGYHVEYNAGKKVDGSTTKMVKDRFLRPKWITRTGKRRRGEGAAAPSC